MIEERTTPYSDEQRAAIGYDGGNAYVAAGPGTGKTHLLVGRYLRLIEDGCAPDRILVLTFSRRAVGELRERIGAALAESGRSTTGLEVRTFHGFASRLLGSAGTFKTRRLLDGFSEDVLFEAVVDSLRLGSFNAATRASRTFRAEAKRLMDDLSRAPAGEFPAIERDASPRLRDLLALHAALVAARERCGASDLNDLVARAVAALRDPQSAPARWLAQHPYAHVLVDEFQDTDVVQLEVLALIGGRLFAVGDEAQAIYRFRGAKHGIVERAQRELAMQRHTLTTSRRCPPDVCAFAAQTPDVGGFAPSSDRADDVPVEVLQFRTTADEVHAVADRVERALAAGTPPNEIAVLLRSTRPFGPLLAGELRRRAIATTESARDALYADQRVGTLRAAFAVLVAPNAQLAWRRLLTALPLGFDPLAVRLRQRAFERFRIDESLLGVLDASGLRSSVISNERIVEAMLRAKQAWDAGDLGTCARRLVRGLRLVAAVLRDEHPADVRAASARLTSVCDGLAQAQRAARAIGAPASCAQIVEAMDEHLDAFAGASETDAGHAAVRISSVHGAKGLEFELVVIADAVEGRFPTRSRATTLLSPGDRALLLAHGVDGASVTDAIDAEEASLWFVALTRTKAQLVVTYAREGLDGAEQRPSRFLGDRAPKAITAVERGSLEIAALRAGDPRWRERLGAERRIAHSPSLAAYARATEAAFAKLDTRALPVPKRLSVSDTVDWLNCPRRVFYGRFLQLPSDESVNLVLGNLLHLVLERFHETETDFRSVADGDPARWLAKLIEIRTGVWSENSEKFDGSAFAQACAVFVDRMLVEYADDLATRARATPFVVEARERAVTVPIGPIGLSGRIDRLDRASDGSALIVDYKSGTAKNKPFADLLAEASATWAQGASIAGTVDHSFTAQLALYASALADVSAFTYIYFKGTKEDRRSIESDSTIVDEQTRARIDGLVTDVRAHLTQPLADGTLTSLATAASDSACMFCNYAEICPGPDGASE